MVNKNIIKILKYKSNILDFYSVLFWYRNIWLFTIFPKNNYVDNDFLKKHKDIINLKNYLKNNFKNYSIIHWFWGLFFIYKKWNLKIIKDLLNKYENPILILEWWRDLGLLLNFPKCCVAQFYREKIKDEFKTKLILDKKFFHIPFAPCSYDCWYKWLNNYKKIEDYLNL